MTQKHPTIILEVDEQGDFNLEVLDGDGKNCVQATQKLESALGTISERQFKPEYRHLNQQNPNQLKN